MSPTVVAPEPFPGLPPEASSNLLAGRKIVVTRPQAQALALSAGIRAAGGIPVWFPTIEIAPLASYRELDRALAGLREFDLAVFVSANAVACAWARLAAPWPAGLAAAATGPGTAASLNARGVAVVIAPAAQFDSEGLLAELRQREFRPRRVLILKGEGGREWLSDQLRLQGARVDSVACYRRVRAGADPAVIERLAQARELSGVVVASSEGGEHLMALLGAPALQWLQDVPIFVPHQRIAQAMRGHGLRRVVQTAGGDAGLMAGIGGYFRAAPQ